MTGTDTKTRFEQYANTVNEFHKQVSNMFENLILDGLEQCGYSKEWVMENPDKITRIGSYGQKMHIIAEGGGVLKIDSGYRMTVSDDGYTIKQVFKPSIIEVIKRRETNESE